MISHRGWIEHDETKQDTDHRRGYYFIYFCEQASCVGAETLTLRNLLWSLSYFILLLIKNLTKVKLCCCWPLSFL